MTSSRSSHRRCIFSVLDLQVSLMIVGVGSLGTGHRGSGAHTRHVFAPWDPEHNWEPAWKTAPLHIQCTQSTAAHIWDMSKLLKIGSFWYKERPTISDHRNKNGDMNLQFVWYFSISDIICSNECRPCLFSRPSQRLFLWLSRHLVLIEWV